MKNNVAMMPASGFPWKQDLYFLTAHVGPP